MNNLRKAAEALLNHWEAGEYENCTGYMAGHIRVLREALAEPEDARITDLTTLMAEPTVTGVIFEVHRGPLSKSIREYGECPCPTYVKGDVRIEVKGLEPIRIRIMSEAYDLADRGDSEGYNSVQVMCSDVLALIETEIATEREACAQVCEQLGMATNGMNERNDECAVAIRARGEK